jgi:putative pyruvate formate lyase activating enzyme
MLKLQNEGAHNINLVTAAHFTPHVVRAIEEARAGGLSLPIVYNSSGYESVETLKMLDGYVDIYLPDLKYYRSSSAERLSKAKDYPEVARAAIEEMVRQRPSPVIKDGIMTSGVVVRLLLLPIVAGVSYEIIKYAGRHDNWVANVLSKPGLWVQKLTTKEPTEDMVEVAIVAVEGVLDWKSYLEEQRAGKDN